MYYTGFPVRDENPDVRCASLFYPPVLDENLKYILLYIFVMIIIFTR
jgi:hypothetical protein